MVKKTYRLLHMFNPFWIPQPQRGKLRGGVATGTSIGQMLHAYLVQPEIWCKRLTSWGRSAIPAWWSCWELIWTQSPSFWWSSSKIEMWRCSTVGLQYLAIGSYVSEGCVSLLVAVLQLLVFLAFLSLSLLLLCCGGYRGTLCLWYLMIIIVIIIAIVVAVAVVGGGM